METELLKAGFIITLLVLFVVVNLATSKEFWKQIVDEHIKSKSNNLTTSKE